jgi:hypothetical protein
VSAGDTARRLVEDVQRLGLNSASAVVDRYAVAVEQALGLDPGADVTAPPDPGALVDAAARMAQAYLGLLDGLAGIADRRRPPTGDLEAIHLPTTLPGASSPVSVWVHNGTVEPVETPVRLGPLVSAEGTALPSGAAVAEPTSVTVPAGGRAEVVLRVDVPADQPPGRYVGLVLSPGVRPLALHLDVEDGAVP